MRNKLEHSLVIYNQTAWIDIQKCGSTAVFDLVGELKSKFYLDFQKNIRFDEAANLFNTFISKQNFDSFDLMLHVRDPWERFVSAVIQDMRQKYKQLDESQTEAFCQNILVNYEKFNFEMPDKSYSDLMYKDWVLLTTRIVDRIFLALRLLGKRVSDLQIWQFQFLDESLFSNWNIKQKTKLKNTTNQYYKNMVSNILGDHKFFVKSWRQINQNDIKLFDLVSNQKMCVLGLRDFVRIFFQKQIL